MSVCTVLMVNGLDYSSTVLFCPKWFEPSRPFGFLHLPTSGLYATGQHAEVLEVDTVG